MGACQQGRRSSSFSPSVGGSGRQSPPRTAVRREKHLQQRRSAPEKLSPSHLLTRDALEPQHYEYFERLPLFIRLPEFGAAVVHAGAFPGVPLEEQPPAA